MNQSLKKTLNGIVVAVAIALIVYATWSWIASVRLNLVWRAQAERGLPMSTQEMMPKPGPAEDNAALLLNRAFSTMKRDAPETEQYNATIDKLLAYGFSDGTDRDGDNDPRYFTQEQKMAIHAMFSSAPLTQTLAFLEQATLKHECNFGINYARGASTLLPHLSHLRNAVRLLTLRAWVRADSGNFKGGLQDVRTALRISNFLKSEPVLISHLVRISCNHIALQTLNVILNATEPVDLPDTDLQALITQLEMQIDAGNSSLVAALDGERILLGNWCFERLVHGEMGSKELEAMGMPRSLRFYHNAIGRPWVKTDFRLYLLNMGKYRDMATKPFHEMARQPSLAESIPKFFPLARTILPALDSVYRQSTGDHAEIALAHIGLMITRHIKSQTRIPTDLGELSVQGEFPRDPFSGKQFAYRQAGEGYVLYSVGPDLEDNHGSPYDKYSKTGDMVWKIRD